MSFKRGDSFDLYSGITTGGFPLETVWTFGRSGYLTGGNAAYSLIAGRFGGQAVRISDGGISGVTWINRALTAGRSALTLSFANRRSDRGIASTGDGVAIARLRSSTAQQLSLGINFLGKVLAWGPDGLLIGGSAEADQVLAGNWHTWEVELEGLDTVAGRIGIWIDGGREALGLTGLDLTGMTAATVDNFDLCMQTLNQQNVSCDFDDTYELDVAARLAQPIKAEVLRPNVDIGPNQATPTSGTDHFAMIDDTTADGDTSSLTFPTVAQKERVGLTNLSTVPAAIYALQAVTVSRKTDAGLVQQETKFVSGPTVAVGHTQTLGINFAPEFDVTEVDPDTGTALNATGVNAIELEVERTA